MNFPIIFCLILSILRTISSIHVQICGPLPPAIDTLRGLDGVRALVFSPLQCNACYTFLRRLNEIARHYKIIIVAQDYETDYIISSTMSTFSNLKIQRMSYSSLGAADYDVLLVDRCGRVAERPLKWPESNVVRSNALEEALRRASGASCGPCQPQQQKKINAYINQDQYQARRNPYLYTPPPPKPPITIHTTTTTTTTIETPTDYADYYDDNGGSTVGPGPQTQIPRPPASSKKALSTQPSASFNDQYELKTCNDEYCYHEMLQTGSLDQAPCCKKGVYLTDVCVPGKCSNSTIQLCCFQKFLRAKFACCNDKNMDDVTNTKTTNRFNKCCNENFVVEDSCCTPQAAAKYWKTVYDVCFPNVLVNFSSVSFEVHYTEGVRVHDMSKTSSWNFACPYGKKTHQYAFLP